MFTCLLFSAFLFMFTCLLLSAFLFVCFYMLFVFCCIQQEHVFVVLIYNSNMIVFCMFVFTCLLVSVVIYMFFAVVYNNMFVFVVVV